MFIQFKNFRITSYKKVGATGFEAAVYNGKTKIGTTNREDGKTSIEDITFNINQKNLNIIEHHLRAKKKIQIDNEEVSWSIQLMIYCLIENKHVIDKVKECKGKNIVLKYKSEDFIRVLDIKDTAPNIHKLKKDTLKEIHFLGADLLDLNERISAA